MANKQKERESTYRDSLKSMDTEETFDLIFYRPIGYAWAMLAKRLGITPNAITIASIFLGAAAGVAFYFDNLWWNMLGVFLLVWANSFDSADGQLARLTHQYSRIGRILDGLSGDIWFLCIYVALCLRENVTSSFFMDHLWLIWLVAAMAGGCHAVQASMADYYRQFHLYFLKGEEGSELDSTAALRERFRALDWHRDFWQKLSLMFYTNYTAGQERRTVWMQRLRQELRVRFGGNVPLQFRDAFRVASRPLMMYTNILSFNTRTFALFASILIFRMPWLYFVFELTVLNGVLIYMVARHERICRRFTIELKDGKY